jgi:SAM-dependent methyltransferase
MNKSNTDRHWNDRALSESDDARVNIADTVQRDLELQFIFSQLPADAQVLEVGCGNGYVTRQLRERVRHVDAFDYAENMVARGRANYGETNNRFFHGSVLDPQACEAGAYDAAVCVRVLINLRDAGEQETALGNIARWLKPGGKLILVVPNRASVHRDVALRMGLIGALDELSPRDHLVGHLRVYDFAMLEADLAGAGFRVEHRFGSFLKTVPNSMMMDYPEALLNALDAISDSLPPEILANIGVRAVLA